MEEHPYDTTTWSTHELHPKSKSTDTVEWIFLIDLLNFSFFSDETDPERRFFVAFKGKKYEGYWGLCAAVNRALEAGIPITSPRFWIDVDEATLRHIFIGEGIEEVPMMYLTNVKNCY
jgi:Potential Queuosine, Q, salvage protein family